VTYYQQPIAYVQPVMSYGFQNSTGYQPKLSRPNRKSSSGVSTRSIIDNRVFDGITNFGYYTPMPQFQALTLEEAACDRIDARKSAEEIFEVIMTQFDQNEECRVSHLNRMLAKCSTLSDFDRAVKVLQRFNDKKINTTTETGTLFIKAACRAGIPEQALSMLKNCDQLKIFPTLGGMHYLMINFSLKKDTSSVLETFQVTKWRQLKPTTRTYHILIRECVDNNLIQEALKLATESREHDIIPNRVTYNILMNGCRKNNMPLEILQLRSEMNQYNIEINDTTVKFTVLAHMMLGDTDSAVKAFLSYADASDPAKLLDFSNKFLEDEEQREWVVKLFQALEQRNIPISPEIRVNLLQVTPISQTINDTPIKKIPEQKENRELKIREPEY